MIAKNLQKNNQSNINKKYNDFIRQIEIIDVRIYKASLNNLGCEELPLENMISSTVKSWYENIDSENKFYGFQRHNVSIKDEKLKKQVARLSVTFCGAYSTNIPMTDELFDIFSARNLTLNIWPYFREFTHNMFSRMGLANVVAPAYKLLRTTKA